MATRSATLPLDDNAKRREPPPPFKVQARGARPGLNFDKIAELLEELEGPGHR
jgi:hypothetical protein